MNNERLIAKKYNLLHSDYSTLKALKLNPENIIFHDQVKEFEELKS